MENHTHITSIYDLYFIPAHLTRAQIKLEDNESDERDKDTCCMLLRLHNLSGKGRGASDGRGVKHTTSSQAFDGV